MLKKLIILFLISLSAAPCSGQTYNYLVGNNLDYAQFDNQGKLAYTEDANWDLIYTQFGGGANIASICNSVGDMLFYTDGYAIYNNSRKIMENGDSLLADKSPENVSVIIPATDSTYYLIYCTDEDSFYVGGGEFDSTSVLYYALINVRTNNGLGCVVQKNVPLMGSSVDFYGGTHCRNADGSYWYVTRNERAFYSFYVDEGGISLRDSLLYNTYTNYPDSLLNLSPDTFRSGQTHAQKFSNLGDCFLSGMSSYTGINNLSGYIFQQLELHKFRFDKATGAMQYDQPVFFKTFGTSKFITDYTFNVSTNDSVIYITYLNWNSDRENSSLHLYNTSQQPLVQNVREIKKWVGDRYRGAKYNGLNIDPNGDLYMLHYGPLGPLNTGYYRTTVLNANSAPSASIKSTELSFRYISGNTFPNHLYDYLKPKPSIDYDCQAHMQIQNKSDLNGGMNSFTWYFTLEDGSIDTVTGFEPNLMYTVNGDYPYKCYSFSPRASGYGEYYFDTLKIRIPPKPVADFSATDTVVCAFSQAEFINQSTTDTIHPTNGQKWVWTFGDGETKTVLSPESKSPVSHVYKTPGTYTVSLFYSNGYCDSTLTKNQYIKVVDAPAPGFSIDNNRGCSPFRVNITDTVTKNTVRKEYNYYDGRGWVDVPVNQTNFSQTYPDAGAYWITQRLYGYTGCVTQLDSVRIYVTPGLTAQDSMHVTHGTYPLHPSALGALVIHSDGRQEWRGDRENIKLTWSTHPAAVEYKLSRNGTAIAQIDATTTTFYRDSLERPNYYTYEIIGIDSCGTASSSGRTVSPIYLTGQASENNELAVIQFSPYTESLYELNYEVLTEENGVWYEINPLAELGIQTSYQDDEFLTLALQSDPVTPQSNIALEKCYIIRNQYGDVYSNVLCLPYKPTVFIPTAFTPNGDNLNDVYRPVTFGIEQYQMRIYNRYGQLIADHDQTSSGWDAADAPMGAYMVTVRAKGTDNRWYNLKQTVTVVR